MRRAVARSYRDDVDVAEACLSKAALALFVDEDVDAAESALNEALILAPLDERVLACCRHAEKSFGALPCI